jgi:hypothetical protein
VAGCALEVIGSLEAGLVELFRPAALLQMTGVAGLVDTGRSMVVAARAALRKFCVTAVGKRCSLEDVRETVQDEFFRRIGSA